MCSLYCRRWGRSWRRRYLGAPTRYRSLSHIARPSDKPRGLTQGGRSSESPATAMGKTLPASLMLGNSFKLGVSAWESQGCLWRASWFAHPRIICISWTLALRKTECRWLSRKWTNNSNSLIVPRFRKLRGREWQGQGKDQLVITEAFWSPKFFGTTFGNLIRSYQRMELKLRPWEKNLR